MAGQEGEGQLGKHPQEGKPSVFISASTLINIVNSSSLLNHQREELLGAFSRLAGEQNGLSDFAVEVPKAPKSPKSHERKNRELPKFISSLGLVLGNGRESFFSRMTEEGKQEYITNAVINNKQTTDRLWKGLGIALGINEDEMPEASSQKTEAFLHRLEQELGNRGFFLGQLEEKLELEGEGETMVQREVAVSHALDDALENLKYGDPVTVANTIRAVFEGVFGINPVLLTRSEQAKIERELSDKYDIHIDLASKL